MTDSIEKCDDGWYWYDETWNGTGPLPTEADAIREQRRYCDRYLSERGWCPTLDGYVWWTPSSGPSRVLRIPSRVVAEALASDSDWIVRTMTGPQDDHYVMTRELAPMTEMEVIALASSWPNVIL